MPFFQKQKEVIKRMDSLIHSGGKIVFDEHGTEISQIVQSHGVERREEEFNAESIGCERVLRQVFPLQIGRIVV